MDRYTFRWRDETYRVERGTVAFWPNARIIRGVSDQLSFTLTATDALFCQFTLAQDIPWEEDERPDTVAQCTTSLEAAGFTIDTFREALALIQSAPDAPEAEPLVACLTRWFFIAKT